MKDYEPSILTVWDMTVGKALRVRIEKSSSKRCYCCGVRSDLTEHHIIPKEYGGADIEENIVALCANCHKAFHLAFYFQNLKHVNDKILLERLEKLRLFKELEREFKCKR